MYSANDVLKIIEENIPSEYLDACNVTSKILKKKTEYGTPWINIDVTLKPSCYHFNISSQTLCKFDSRIIWFQNPELKVAAYDYVDLESIRRAVCTRIRYLFNFEIFGCCSKYELCSDLKKCIHTDPFYSEACMYRKNLESGKIFYGKNKNV